jgi:RNA polymerase sigma-70 factor (ECF subfamily)
VGGRDAAQDLVQDAFIRLYRKWNDEWLPGPKIASWLYRVVHNCAVDHLRSETRRQALHQRQAVEDEAAASAGPGSVGGPSEAAERASRAMGRLSLRERQLVSLKVYEEKSYKEISEITGLSVGNVGFILHHAMRKMASLLRMRDRDRAGPGEGEMQS